MNIFKISQVDVAKLQMDGFNIFSQVYTVFFYVTLDFNISIQIQSVFKECCTSSDMEYVSCSSLLGLYCCTSLE